MSHPADQPSFLAGLIGAGIAASLTPAMHEREATEHGLRAIYRLIDLPALGLDAAAMPALIDGARHLGFDGLNITHPCKQAVIPLLDALSDNARVLGAVNTVVLREGRRVGHNTDLWGFAEAFRRGLPDVPRDRVVLIGAGGAGVAVAHAALSQHVQRLRIIDVEPARAEALAEALRVRFGPGCATAVTDPTAAMADADGLINATPIGMAKYPGTPIPVSLLRPHHFVADIIYFPLETELLRAARAIGCRTLHGGGMAVFQAVRAFRLFTGLEPDADRMLRHFAALTGSP